MSLVFPIQDADLQRIHKLGSICFDWQFEVVSWNIELVEWFFENQRAFCNLARSNSEVVGFCLSLKQDELGYICWVAVDRYHRRRGIANQMVSESMEALVAAGCSRIGVHARSDGISDKLFYHAGFTDLIQSKREMQLRIDQA